MSNAGIQPLLIVVAATLVSLGGVWAALVGLRAKDRFALWVGLVVFLGCGAVVALFLLGPS